MKLKLNLTTFDRIILTITALNIISSFLHPTQMVAALGWFTATCWLIMYLSAKDKIKLERIHIKIKMNSHKNN